MKRRFDAFAIASMLIACAAMIAYMVGVGIVTYFVLMLLDA